MLPSPQVDKDILSIRNLIDDGKCYTTVRELRWPNNISCPTCNSDHIVKNGQNTKQKERQNYHCQDCVTYFDDLTGTVFEGHHQPLSVWILL